MANFRSYFPILYYHSVLDSISYINEKNPEEEHEIYTIYDHLNMQVKFT